MKISVFPEDWSERKRQTSRFDRIARRSLFAVLKTLQRGSLSVQEAGETFAFGDPTADLRASIEINHSACYRLILLNGSIGAGEAYMSGCWNSPDLTKVIQVLCRNMAQVEQLDGGIARAGRLLARMRHLLQQNSLAGARKNIQAHYDLGNELFRLFLDRRMMYSAALYRDGATSLEQAQEHKLTELARKLEAKPGDHIVEIGTGWGGLAIYLARHHGCHVTTTTISAEQYAYTRQAVTQAGLDRLITVLNLDYRELAGRFDKLVSVEMIEAVGYRYLPVFFKKCDQLLKPGGVAVLQAITIPQQRFASARANIDFIQKYIFPGGFLPSIECLDKHAGRYSRLHLAAIDDIGTDYAETLAQWRKRFLDQRAAVTELGFDTVFKRLWEFYFGYCEGGFRERQISAVQATFQKV